MKTQASIRDMSDYEIRYHILNHPVTAANWPDQIAKLLQEKNRRKQS